MPISKSLLKNISNNAPYLTVLDETQEQSFTTEDLQDLLKALENNTVIGRIVWNADIEHDAILVKAIEDRLAKNNRDYRDRPSSYEYAVLSEHVYEDLTLGQSVQLTRVGKKSIQLPEWEVQAIFKDIKNGYYAAAYYHPQHHFLVLAHRGTDASLRSMLYRDDAKDLNTDIDVIYNSITAQQISAYAAAEQLVKLAQENHWRFSTTGHALGGWLAQITLIHCHLDYNYPQAHAVTFDSPGAKPMLRKLNAGSTLDYRLSSHQLDIVTYLSAPNIINTCHEQLGTLYRLFPQQVDIQLGKNIKDYLTQYSIPKFVINQIVENLQDIEIIQWLQTVQGHSITGLVNCFDSKSGLPKRIEYIQKWPQVVWYKENHPIQDWTYQQGKSLNIPDSISERASQTVLSAFEWLGLSGGGLAGWLAGSITGQVAAEVVKKAVRYTADLQLVQTVELALNYYSGNADKSAYQAYLQFANTTNDFHPSIETLPIDKRYNLHFKAQYKLLPTGTNRLQSRQFHSNELIQFLHQCKVFCVLLSSLSAFNKEKELLNLYNTYRLIEGNAVEILDAGLTPAEFRRLTRRYLERFPELNNLSLLLPAALQRLSSQQQAALQKEVVYAQLKFDTFAELLVNRYKQQDRLFDLFGEQERSIADSYVNLALVKEDTLRDEEQRTLSKSAEQDESENLLHNSIRDLIYTRPQTIELSSLFQQHNEKTQRIMVLGEPGAGKTTFCQYITYQWTQGQLWSGRYEWVFWIQLRHLNQYEKSTRKYNWADIVAKELFDRVLTAEENTQFKDFFKPALEQNHVLFLIDGYDEIASKHMNSEWLLKEAVDELLQMGHYLLMSRPHVVAGLRHLTNMAIQITGFTPANVATYIEDFFITQPEKAKRLQAFLQQNPAVRSIARLPINLQLICSSWRQEESQKVPTLTELYDSMLATLLKRELSKKDKNSHKYLHSVILEKFKTELDALGALAFHGLREGQVIIPSADIDRLLAGFVKQSGKEDLLYRLQQLGLLKPMDTIKSPHHSDHYFIHKTFQEFFAAYRVAKLFKLKTGQLEAKKLLATYKYSPALETVWWFTAGLLSMEIDTHPMNIFFTSLVYDEPIDMFGLYSRQLVIRCLDETRVSNKLQGAESYLEWIVNKDIWELHPKIRNLLMQQLAHSPFVKEKTKILDIVLQETNNPDPIIGRKALEALKLLGHGSSAVIATLLRTLEDSSETAIKQAIRALGFLGQGYPTVVEALVSITKSSSPVTIRIAAIAALGILDQGTPRVINVLINALNDSDSLIREEAARAFRLLGPISEGTELMIGALDHALNDSSIAVRGLAAVALSQLGYVSPVAINNLIDFIEFLYGVHFGRSFSPYTIYANKEFMDYTRFVGQLGRQWPTISKALCSVVSLEKVHPTGFHPRKWAATIALGYLEKGSPEVAETLLYAIRNSDSMIKSLASETIERLGLQQLPEFLAELRKPGYSKFWGRPYNKPQHTPEVEVFISTLQDNSYFIKHEEFRRMHAEALRQLSRNNLSVISLLFIGWMNRESSLKTQFFRWLFDKELLDAAKKFNELAEILMWLEEGDRQIALPRIFYRKNGKIYFHETRSLHPQQIPFESSQQESINKFLDQAIPQLPKQLLLDPQPPVKVVVEDNDLSFMTGTIDEYLEEESQVTFHQRKLLSIAENDDDDFVEPEEYALPSLQQTSSASRTTAGWFAPIASAAQWLGAKSASAASLASDLWKSVSDKLTSSTTAESKSEKSNSISDFSVSPLLKVAEVAVPVINSLSEERGWFGHKPLTTEKAAQQKMQHAAQLKEINAHLDILKKHFVLRRRKEYGVAREAFEQAQLRFKNYFQNDSYSRAITESENREVIRLIVLADKALSTAEILLAHINDYHPDFIKTIASLEKEHAQLLDTLKSFEQSFTQQIKKIQRQQNIIVEKLNVKDIAAEQEAALSLEWDQLDEAIFTIRKAHETAEPAFQAISCLLRKVSNYLEFDCLPEHVEAAKKTLYSAKAAIVELSAKNKFTGDAVISAITIADKLRDSKIIVSARFNRKKPSDVSHFFKRKNCDVIIPPIQSASPIVYTATSTPRHLL